MSQIENEEYDQEYTEEYGAEPYDDEGGEEEQYEEVEEEIPEVDIEIEKNISKEPEYRVRSRQSRTGSTADQGENGRPKSQINQYQGSGYPDNQSYQSRGSVHSSQRSQRSRYSQGSRASSAMNSRKSYKSQRSHQRQLNPGWQPQLYNPPQIKHPKSTRIRKKKGGFSKNDYFRRLPESKKNTLRLAGKNFRIGNIDGRQKQPETYESLYRIDPSIDAYFYPNPDYIVHPMKKKRYRELYPYMPNRAPFKTKRKPPKNFFPKDNKFFGSGFYKREGDGMLIKRNHFRSIYQSDFEGRQDLDKKRDIERQHPELFINTQKAPFVYDKVVRRSNGFTRNTHGQMFKP